jgi:hypothetical protein
VSATSPTVPTFAIAGAARAGSTALAEAVRQHPDAFVCQPKEPHYYALANQSPAFTGPGDEATINRVAVTDRASFLKLFDGAPGKVARGDGSVSTLYYFQRSISAIRDVNPDMRIVIILRHPVGRAYSSYQYLRIRGFEPIDDFLTAVREEGKRKAQNWHHLWHYTSMSYYADAVTAFIDAFGSDRVHVLFYDDLQSQSAPCIDALYAFLGLDDGRSVAELSRVNASGEPRFIALQKMIGWASGHEVLRGGLKRIVPFAVREKLRSANLKPNTATAREFAELGPLFDDDLQQLQDALGRPLPDWFSPGHRPR